VIPPPSFLFSLSLCVCVYFFATPSFARRSFFIFHLFKKHVGEEKKNEVPRRCWPSGGRTQNEHWPAPPPGYLLSQIKGSRTFEKGGGGQGNHIDRTRLHKRLVVLTSRITEETRASGPNNGGHVSASTSEKREPGALRSLTSKKLCARRFFFSALTHFFELGFIKPKADFLRNPSLQNFRRPKKQKIGDGFRACILSPIARLFRIKHDRNRISSHGVLIGRFFNARRRCDKNVRSFFVSRGR
jgi:hypothetical protein